MELEKILQLNINNFYQKISEEDLVSSEISMDAFLSVVIKKLESSIKDQDFIVAIKDQSDKLTAIITGDDLESLEGFLRKNYIKDEHKMQSLKDTSFYKNFLSKFKVKYKAIENESTVKEMLDIFITDSTVLCVPVINDKFKLIGKITRNDFIDRIQEKVKLMS